MMKTIKRKKQILFVIAAACLTAGISFTAMAAKEGAAGPGEAIGQAEKAKESLEGAGDTKEAETLSKETDKAVLVVGQGGSKIKVSYYEKNEEGLWNRIFDTTGVYGRNGGTYEKREGDGKTPYGVYGINKAFGILDDPGCIMPYTKLTEYDYWVDDSSSSHYNRMVNTQTNVKDWASAEHLIRTAPYYNYVLSLDYNEEAVPGKGSAIFIHCTAEGYAGSSGCICIGENEMKTLITRADDRMKAVILPDEEELKEAWKSFQQP